MNLVGKKRKSIIRWMDPHQRLQVLCTQNLIILTKDTVIKAIAVNDKTSEVFTFAYTVNKTTEVKIRDIRGMNHFSSYETQLVSGVEGVVTAYVKDANNFYMQDPTRIRT